MPLTTPDAISPVLAFLGPIGTWEMIIIMTVALLVFGKRLPEVGRSLGKGIVEFKKGLAGIEEQVKQADTATGKQIDASSSSGASAPSKTPEKVVSEREA